MATVYINERKANNNFIAAGTDANGTVYREPKPQEVLPIAWTGIVHANDNYILPTKDHKTIILLKNSDSAAKNVTFLAGDSYHAADYMVSLAASEEKFVVLESANFADKATGLIKVDTDETTASKVFVSVLEVR